MAITSEEVFDRLRKLMQQTVEVDVDLDAVTGTTSIESLGFDSLSILDLMYDIQQEFDLEFDAEEMIAIRSVDQLVAFIVERVD